MYKRRSSCKGQQGKYARILGEDPKVPNEDFQLLEAKRPAIERVIESSSFSRLRELHLRRLHARGYRQVKRKSMDQRRGHRYRQDHDTNVVKLGYLPENPPTPGCYFR